MKLFSLRRLFFWLVALPLLFALAAYARDPLMWQRFVGTFTNSDDATYMNLTPTERVGGTGEIELPQAQDGEHTISADALREVERYAKEYESYALIVVHKGVVQTEWYNDGWDRKRLTQSQSMHKSVLPILIRAAIKDNHIGSPADPIGLYIDEWRNDPRGQITIFDLMIMSSGLEEYPFSLNPFSDEYRWLFASDTTPILLRTPFDFEPRSKFSYNNINAELLGLIIERSTGKRYADYLDEKLWRPLGNLPANLWLDSEGGKAHSSCCLLASAMDWARFGMMLLGRGTYRGTEIVDAAWIDEMTTPSPVSQWYGYQIWLSSDEPNPRINLAGGYQRTDPFLTSDTFYCSGYGVQRVYVVRSEDLVLVRMGPSNGMRPIKEGWDNSHMVNTIIRGLIE